MKYYIEKGYNFLSIDHVAHGESSGDYLGFDLKETDVRESVKNSKVPILFVHGKEDTFVPTRMGIELYELCEGEKELFLAEGAPHAESIRVDEQGYHQRLNKFIEKYL